VVPIIVIRKGAKQMWTTLVGCVSVVIVKSTI